MVEGVLGFVLFCFNVFNFEVWADKLMSSFTEKIKYLEGTLGRKGKFSLIIKQENRVS